MTRVLGIETSCDETAAALVQSEAGGLNATLRPLSNVVFSQLATHAAFGGVVPEVASREHIARIGPIVCQALGANDGEELHTALAHVDAIAVTLGPGLLGSLLVGAHMAKGLALAAGKPLIGLNHLEAHLSAAWLCEQAPKGPHVALIVSGGHTHLYHQVAPMRFVPLGATRDDAAGEAFDKIAKWIGLGYPGGAALEKAAHGGDPGRFAMPRAKLPNSFDFSFSGLKTAAINAFKKLPHPTDPAVRRDFCASVQQAIADALADGAVAAALHVCAPAIVLGGGVACNGCVRQALAEKAGRHGLVAWAPPRALCTDNAAMVAAAGMIRHLAGQSSGLDAPVRSRWPMWDAARAA